LSDIAICLEGVKKSYGTLQVLRGVELTVAAGEFVAIVGKSGSGKSTVLGVMSGLEPADEGRIAVEGADVSKLSEPQAADMRRRAIGIVFQSYNLIPSLSAFENVLLPTFHDARTDNAEKQARVEELLKQVGLADRLRHRPSTLSGGEQQRVAIARALVNRPSILLADEPTGNLDADSGKAVLELLTSLVRTSKTTLVLVTHDADVAAKADRIVSMQDGRIVDGNA
jgi:putative ABC transport system ATP-binding protein